MKKKGGRKGYKFWSRNMVLGVIIFFYSAVNQSPINAQNLILHPSLIVYSSKINKRPEHNRNVYNLREVNPKICAS